MEKNNIHNIDSMATYTKRKILNNEMKDFHIVEVTTDHMKKIVYEEIEELLKTIPKIHHSVIEKAVREQNYELLGVTIIMAISQSAQANIKKALYP